MVDGGLAKQMRQAPSESTMSPARYDAIGYVIKPRISR